MLAPLCLSKKKYIFYSLLVAISTPYLALAKKPKKEWTFIVYVAADNDLRGFAARNIKQMAQVGSNERLNIVVQLDIRNNANKKITRRYYIEKNKIQHINANDPHSQRMDSGDPKTLISCCSWAIQNYPANHYALVLWNHGTGIIDPMTGKVVRSADLFTYNPSIHKLELDRSVGFLDFINTLIPAQHGLYWDESNQSYIQQDERGICWDDTTGHYLTNQKIEGALKEICSRLLHGKKFDLIIFDACLMSMVEVGSIMKNYAHIMTGSQEVELGTGLDYNKALNVFRTETPDAKAFSAQIVQAYKDTYHHITNDYTHSAIHLDNIVLLEKNVDMVGQLLLQSLHQQKGKEVKKAIQKCRNKRLCTHFDEPSYIDLYHFYQNLKETVPLFKYTNFQKGAQLANQLKKELNTGQSIIKKLTIDNVAGKNLSKAHGISIYFPERRIHPSYRKTAFGVNNHWATFLTQYLLL